jgi:hypothetical protein
MVNGFACFLRNEASNQGANAHNELAASTGFGTFDARERDFPANRGPARGKFAFRPKIKI